jgi:hypothetical protein
LHGKAHLMGLGTADDVSLAKQSITVTSLSSAERLDAAGAASGGLSYAQGRTPTSWCMSRAGETRNTGTSGVARAIDMLVRCSGSCPSQVEPGAVMRVLEPL